jgi:hypothetical protein
MLDTLEQKLLVFYEKDYIFIINKLNKLNKLKMAETYQSKWKQFITESQQHLEFPYDELKNLLTDKGGEENAVEAYIESLKMDMDDNMAEYATFTTDDFIEDFENYVADKMGS